jgi:catechol 2,3-dioxygenase-like lactoylglutathione lyase family enzyme
MLGYATIGTTDYERAKTFYCELLADLGAKILFDTGRLSFIGSSMAESMIAICIPFNENDPQPGNGNMLAFPAGSRENVDKLYNKAIELGAADEGAPGQRLPIFYGAYFRDFDGNKCCFYHMGE